MQEPQNAAQRTSHWLSKCQNVLTKWPFFNSFSHKLRFVIIWVLSQFDFLKFYHNLSFWVCHNLSFWVLSKFEFCHILSYWVWSQFEFWSFVTNWVLSFITVWVVEFCHNLSIWVSSQFHHNWQSLSHLHTPPLPNT